MQCKSNINKDVGDANKMWITKRFYLSVLMYLIFLYYLHSLLTLRSTWNQEHSIWQLYGICLLDFDNRNDMKQELNSISFFNIQLIKTFESLPLCMILFRRSVNYFSLEILMKISKRNYCMTFEQWFFFRPEIEDVTWFIFTTRIHFTKL